MWVFPPFLGSDPYNSDPYNQEPKIRHPQFSETPIVGFVYASGCTKLGVSSTCSPRLPGLFGFQI